MMLKSTVFVILLSLVTTQAYAKNDKHEDKEMKKQEKKHKRVHKEEKKHKKMNKGMQKRLDSGKALPPGWQDRVKKGDRLEDDVYEQSTVVEPVNRKGEIVIEVDERLIRLHNVTREIIDILK